MESSTLAVRNSIFSKSGSIVKPPKQKVLRGARISPEVIALVRESADIVTVAGEHVQLRRSGVQLCGRCPFHSEKTPSFYVNPSKNLFYCHGCGVGGDAFEFVRLVHKCSFPESVKLLATRAGVSIEGFKPSPELSARVAAIRATREERARFEQFGNQRIDAANRTHRALGRAANHAEDYLRTGTHDPYIDDLAWNALERYRAFEARIEREGLCDLNVLRTEWEQLRDAA